jgi:hypothetical protein
LDIAEAYRQACLLQLSLTFEDLHAHITADSDVGLLLTIQSDCLDTHGMTRTQALVGLALQLVDQLKKIPPESGSRCMQPLLYLCAASGLQLNPVPLTEPYPDRDQTCARNTIEGCHDITNPEPLQPSWLSDNLGDTFKAGNDSMQVSDVLAASISADPDSSHAFTISSFKVAQARSFVKKRLGMLQQLLPPRYTGTALRLAEAIWAEYDCTSDGGSSLYWFDIMVREKLQTFFG